MRTENIRIIIILVITLVSIALANNFDNPTCDVQPRNELVPAGTVFLFLLGHVTEDVEKVHYILKQTTCWLPTENTKAAVLYEGEVLAKLQSSDKFDVIRGKMKSNYESNDGTAITGFSGQIGSIKGVAVHFQDLKDAKNIIIITNQKNKADTDDYYQTFNISGLDSKFKFALIRFDNKTSEDYTSLTVNLDDVKSDSATASNKLRIATRNFVDDTLGRPRLPEEEKQAEKDFLLWVIIVVVVVAILVIGGLIGGCIYWKKKKGKKANMEKDARNKDLEKQKKSVNPTPKEISQVSKAKEHPPEKPAVIAENLVNQKPITEAEMETEGGGSTSGTTQRSIQGSIQSSIQDTTSENTQGRKKKKYDFDDTY